MRARALLTAVAAFAGLVAWAEVVHWQASWRRLGDEVGRTPTAEAVVVLGYRNRGRRANYINRYRVRAGLRSLDRDATVTVLVLCGGRVGGDVSEAELMARYARDRRGFTGPIRLDSTSTTTWENIRNAIPLVEDMDAIKIVSNSLHGERGRAHLWELRPDLAGRLRHAKEHRFGEIAWVKPVAAVIGLRNLAGLRPHTPQALDSRGVTRDRNSC
jgi:vancomycin permeability regulator SanA